MTSQDLDEDPVHEPEGFAPEGMGIGAEDRGEDAVEMVVDDPLDFGAPEGADRQCKDMEEEGPDVSWVPGL